MKLFRHLFALACVLLVSLPALADNKISVAPVNIADNEVKYIDVVLTNTDEIGAVQFNIQLPDFMEFPAGENPIYSERLDGHMPSFNGSRCLIAGFGGKPFSGNDGAIVSLPVKVKDGTSAGTEGKITISNIVISGLGATSGTGTATKYPQEDFDVPASFQKQDVEFSFSVNPTELTINPKSTVQVEFNFKSNSAISGLQASFQMPEGLSITNPVLNSSIGNGMLNVTPNPGNCYTIVYLGYGLSQANEGTFFTFDVVADESFAAESAEIKVFDIVVSDADYKSHDAADFTIAVTSCFAAYNSLIEALNTVENTIPQIKEVIEKECDGVKGDYLPLLDGFTEKVTELRGEIETAYADGTLNDKEKALADEITALGESLTDMLAEAQRAQREFDAAVKNQEAYGRMMAEVNTVRGFLTEMLAGIAEDCPNVKEQEPFTGKEIADKIREIEKKINDYKEEGVCAYEEDAVMEELEALKGEIEALHQAAVVAEEQFKAEQFEAANKAAYEEMLGQLAMAKESFDNMIAAIAEDCSHVAEDFKGEKIAAEIDVLAADIEKFNEEGTCVDNLEDVKARVAAIGEKLAQLQADATAAEEEYKSNMSVYDTMKDQVAVARQTLADALAAIAESCPDVKDQFTGEKIAADIDALDADIEKFNEEGTCADNVEAVNERVAAIGEAIAQLQADATAAEEQYKSEQLETANNAAYDRVNAKLDASRTALAAAVAEIASKYYDVRDQFTGEEIAADIDKVAAELASLNEQWLCAEEEEALNAKIAAIDEAIAGYVDEAKAAQEKHDLDVRNKVAYNLVIAQIDALQAELDAAVARVNENYPDAPVQSYIYTAQGAINDAREDADEAIDAATENGTVFNYTLDAETIKALIAEIEEAAKMLGINEIFGDDLDASSFCDVFTTDGRLVLKQLPVAEIREHLAQGFYIVLVNGKSYKLAIK